MTSNRSPKIYRHRRCCMVVVCVRVLDRIRNMDAATIMTVLADNASVDDYACGRFLRVVLYRDMGSHWDRQRAHVNNVRSAHNEMTNTFSRR